MSEILGIHRIDTEVESVSSEITQMETKPVSTNDGGENNIEIKTKSEWDINTPIERRGVAVSDAILTYNKRFEDSMVFLQNDLPVQITLDDKGVVKAVLLDYQNVKNVLCAGARWYRVVPGKDGEMIEVDVTPSSYLLKDLAQWTISAGKLRLPSVSVLRDVRDGIIIDQDWRIVHTKGYDEKTKFYLTKDYPVAPVPDVPTVEQINEAKEVFWELFREVRYKDKKLGQESVNYQNTIFALITAAIRPTWKGALPLLVIKKSSPRIGGSLLSEIIGICATGSDDEVDKIPFPDDEKEYSTKITAVIMGGEPYASIDNVTSKYPWANPAVLAMSAGNGIVYMREFRKNTGLKRCEPKTFLSYNGINMDIISDVCGRVIPVYLENDRIWQKEVFEVEEDDLRQKAAFLYPKVMWSIGILYQNWSAQGKPEPTECNGNISAYQRLWREVGGMMQCAGYTHVLDNLKEAQMDYNEADNEKASILEAISKQFPVGRWFTPTDLKNIIVGQRVEEDKFPADALINVIPDEWYSRVSSKKLSSAWLGRQLNKEFVDCSVNGTSYILRYVGKKNHGYSTYVLENRVEN